MYNIDSFTYTNNSSKNTILFLHGWGCNKNYFSSLAKKIKFANTLIIDLPGFGDNQNLIIPFTLKDYADSIFLFLKKNKINTTAIIGHSFGGKISVLLSSKIKIKFMILLSPSILNKRRSPTYYAKILIYKLMKNIKALTPFTKKMGSDDYKVLTPTMKKTMSNVINTKCKKEFSKINLPILLIFGNKDKTTPPYLGKKLSKYNKNTALILLEGNHFFYFQNENIIVNIIEEMIKNYD